MVEVTGGEPANVYVKLSDHNAAMRALLAVLPPTLTCNDFHHVRADEHSVFEPCPCLTRYDAAIAAATGAK